MGHTAFAGPPIVEFKAATAAAPSAVGGIIADESDPMVFDILGSVTGVVDEVKDIVMPGAFADTLIERTPKIIKDHDWGQRLGRVLSIKELLPGDPNLPSKLPNGKPWPSQAGALIAKVRLFDSPEGKQAAERWREDPEQQFSIGYVAHKAIQRKDKIRALIAVKLLEISDVLWGAMPLCGTLSGALATKMLPVGEEAKALGPDDQETADATEAALHRLADDEIDWGEVDAAIPAGRELAELEPADENPPAGTEPEDENTPEGVEPVDDQVAATGDVTAEGVEGVEEKAQGGADRNRGNAENLRRWYVHGEGAAKIRWGEPGDYMRCVKIAEKHMGPRAHGYCQLRHIDATGAAAGHAPSEQKAMLDRYGLVDGTTPDPVPQVLYYNPQLEVGEFAGAKGTDVTVVEVKDYPRLPGTLEERMEAIREACWIALRGAPVVQTDSAGDDVPVPAGYPSRYEWNHVRVDATYSDRVIATRHNWDNPTDQCESYEMAYDWDGQTVTLSDPSPVELQVVAIGVDDGSDGPVEYSSPTLAAAAAGVKDVTAQLASGIALEGKAGRVLSSANANRLQSALQHLLAVAAAAGIELHPVTEPEPKPTPPAPTHRDSTAPSAQPEMKALTPEELRATLASLEA